VVSSTPTTDRTPAKVARRILFVQFRVLRGIGGYLGEEVPRITLNTRNHTKDRRYLEHYKYVENTEEDTEEQGKGKEMHVFAFA
jgi:hypothetical protein